MPFVWKRFYRTGHSHDSGLGHGWTHSAGEKLYLHDQTVDVMDEEGRQITFKRPLLHQRSKLIDEEMDLDFVSENSFILKQEGQWDKVFTRLGNGTFFSLTQLRHQAYQSAKSKAFANNSEQGYVINLSYDANNALLRIQGNWGKSLKLKRNKQGRVSLIELSNDKTRESKVVAQYEYSDDGDLIAHRNAQQVGERYQYTNHIITQRTLATGFSYYFEWTQFDNGARCIRNWGDHGIYDYHFQWDPENNSSCAVDSRGFKSTFIYNKYGLMDQEIDNEGLIHKFEYQNGRKTAYIDPDGNKTEFFYDEYNHPTGHRDALGNTQTLHYFKGKPTEFIDKNGAQWKRKYNAQGQLISVTDPFLFETHYTYNTNGFLAQSTDPEGRITRYHWNEQGELTELVDYLDNKQLYQYDSWGQITERHEIAQGQNEAGITYFKYNKAGLIENITDPLGETTQYKYNDNNQLIEHIDPQGRTTTFEYDGLSQVVKRTNAKGHSLSYEYDKERNLIALINENGERYSFAYDGNERLIKETGFDGRNQHYQYNKAGHLIKHLDAGIAITEFERDALGQMLSKTSRHISNTTEPEISHFRYTPAGQLLETYNQHQFIEFSYDRLGNLEKEHHSDLKPGKNKTYDRIQSSFADISYGNIWPGIRSSITLPDGQQIEYTYSPDIKRQLDAIQFNGKVITQIKRDELGREIQRDQGQLSTSIEYDPMGRLKKQHTVNQSNKQTPIHREYGYDQFSNLNVLRDGDHETRYVYDVLNRIQKTEGSIEEQFAFDPAGNILSSSGEKPTETIQPEHKNAQIKGNRLTLQGDRKFEYDERGNLIKESRGKGGKLITEFEYNLQNQLVKTTKNGQTTEYKYDPLGRRIEKKDEFGKTNYLWAGDQLVQESRNNIKKTYLYEPHSFKPVALVQDDEVYHYHLDHLGTPRELTNEQGKIVWKVRYKTYGNVALNECEEIENNIRFQGQYFDEETGLHYNRHRYYNPDTGQFINQDPIGLLGGINNYQYAPNPTGWVDPFGLTCKDERRQRHHSKSAEYTKHTKASTEDEAKEKSANGGAAQYWGDELSETMTSQQVTAYRNTLEKEALSLGVRIPQAGGSDYYVYDAGRTIGYNEGKPVTHMRVEVTKSPSPEFHGHPITKERYQNYLNTIV
jgi:RHS repeat-associated protein